MIKRAEVRGFSPTRNERAGENNIISLRHANQGESPELKRFLKKEPLTNPDPRKPDWSRPSRPIRFDLMFKIGGFVLGLLFLIGLLVYFVSGLVQSENFYPRASKLATESVEDARSANKGSPERFDKLEKDVQYVLKVITELQDQVKGHGKQLATNGKALDRLKHTAETVVRDLKQDLDSKQKEVKALKREKKDLSDQLLAFQKKLEAADEPERKRLIDSAVLHLKRLDIETILIAEKLTVRESGGKNVKGPWVRYRGPDDENSNPGVKRFKDGKLYHRAVGPLQMMSAYIPEWSEEATGIRYTPDQLVNDPDAYRKTALFQIRKLLIKYKRNPKDVKSHWHSGNSYEKAVKREANDGNMTTKDYVPWVDSANTVDPKVWSNLQKWETLPQMQ